MRYTSDTDVYYNFGVGAVEAQDDSERISRVDTVAPIALFMTTTDEAHSVTDTSLVTNFEKQ